MERKKPSILWIDNDPAFLESYVEELRKEGYEVVVARGVLEAERLVAARTFRIVILDAMIPTVSDEEEAIYLPELTERTLKTGLIFYKRLKTELEERKTIVLVLTVRIDKGLNMEFVEAGLPPDRFATKMELAEVPVFMRRIRALVAEIASSDRAASL